MLKQVSLIVGIVLSIFTIFWAIFNYIHPNNQKPTTVFEPESKIDVAVLRAKQKTEKDLYLNEYIIDINKTVPNIFIKVFGQTIDHDIETTSLNTNLLMLGNTGRRDGYAFTNIPQAIGKYHIIVYTKTDEDLKLEWEIN